MTPGHLGSNPRVVKEATALAEAGHQVHVVATKVLPGLESRDQDVLKIAPFQTTRLELDSKLARVPDRVLRSLAQALERVFPRPDLASLSQSSYTRPLWAAAIKIPADLYIAHYPPALPAVRAAAARHRGIYAFDAEDFHPGDFREECVEEIARIDRIERSALAGAAYVTAASPGIAEAYQRRYGIPRPAVILNAFSKREAFSRPTEKGSEQGPSLYWFSQVRGTKRGLECALEGIARAECRPRFVIRGYPEAGFDDAFLARARALGCDQRIALLSPEDPSRMVELAARHDAGLVGETGETENRRIALTNKQFTYLVAGVPPVMSDVPAHVAFAEDTEGASFLYRNGDPADLARVLDHLFGNPERLAAARAQAWRLGQERFNFELEATKLVAVAEAALANSARARA